MEYGALSRLRAEQAVVEGAASSDSADPQSLNALVQLVRELSERNNQLVSEVEQLQHQLRAAQELPRQSERRVVTVLFADLRDSTALAERLPPDNMIALLNSYLGALAKCVLAHGGIVDKFFGDGLMAVFGTLDESEPGPPVAEPDAGALQAADAFLDMRGAVKQLNAARTARSDEPIHFGVGIHTGDVVFGPVGFFGRSDYTALGDTVNTAARLSGICSGLQIDIVMSDKTASRLTKAGLTVHELGPHIIRGKAKPIPISTLR